ncbi:nicotinamide N-methyltransferase-like [Lissotriton helveticus]
MESVSDLKDLYQKEFDTERFFQTYYNPNSEEYVEYPILTFILENLHKTFSSGEVKGDLLIDIGSGPSIHTIISACECFKEIIASDWTDTNRQAYERWLRNEPGAFDWTPVLSMVCELEGDRTKCAEKEKKIRATVKQVLKCDVTESNPLNPVILPPADCLVTSLCLEAACTDLNTYTQALRNITTLLKTGGHLVLIGVIGCNNYQVGQKLFPDLHLSEEFVKTTITSNGYVIKDMKMNPIVCNKKPDCANDAHVFGFIFFLAQKTSK